jgi:hypothetical protein
MWSLAPDLNHEIALMFHLHNKVKQLKDSAWPDLPRGAAR